MKTLIVTSCTGEKKVSPSNKLFKEDFLDASRLKQRELELQEYAYTAGEMYTGMQHLRLMEGIETLRNTYGKDSVDLCIVSAGYGLIKEEDKVVPYEVTFNSMKASEVDEWAKFLNINKNLNEAIKGYDIVIFLLGDKYLRSLSLPVESANENQRLIFLASKTSKKLIPNKKPYYFLEVGQEDAKSFSYGLIGLKGYLIKLLFNEISRNGLNILDEIYNNPEKIMDILNKYRKSNIVTEQLSISEIAITEKSSKKAKTNKKKEVFDISNIIIPREEYAKNYNSFKMKYFIPDNDDRVDPNFNFITEDSNVELVEGLKAYDRDVYSHEIYENPNYDGILVSKVAVPKNSVKEKRIKEIGIHNYLRYPKEYPVMGDCGAFSYIKDEVPPYTTDEILDYYENLGFDIGVSIDHLILGYADDENERERRFKITQDNAAEFIKKHKEGNYTFKPSGIAQGWDVESYVRAVSALLDMGYKHISIGSLALAKTEYIVSVLQGIKPLLKEDTELHLFGVQRLEAIKVFRQLGVTAFDSSSSLRTAWTSATKNYFGVDGEFYAAARVPQSDGSIIKKLVENGQGSFEKYKNLELEALDALRKFDKSEISKEDAFNSLMKYMLSTCKPNEREKKEKLYTREYTRLLKEMPWKKCNCDICKSVGIEVAIFRGNNRNRRRGFHNTHVFYELFKKIRDEL